MKSNIPRMWFYQFPLYRKPAVALSPPPVCFLASASIIPISHHFNRSLNPRLLFFFFFVFSNFYFILYNIHFILFLYIVVDAFPIFHYYFI